ncbi:flagellar hook-length control protein FliK [Kordiimonas sp.]|uniref:flagellar hook-length control protein FliK n=1 Tax=Kordiimonas sp. TaxID=1970157 RepID=UPI003A91A3FC
MNPIEQLTQTQNASPLQAIAALFGPQRAEGSTDAAAAAEFANLLQSAQAVSGTGKVAGVMADGSQIEGLQGVGQLSNEQAEVLASLGIALPADQVPATFQDIINKYGPENVVATEGSTLPPADTKVLASSVVNPAAATVTAGGQAAPALDFASLPEGARAELLNSLQAGAANGTVPPLTLTAPNGETHVLPVAELVALINGAADAAAPEVQVAAQAAAAANTAKAPQAVEAPSAPTNPEATTDTQAQPQAASAAPSTVLSGDPLTNPTVDTTANAAVTTDTSVGDEPAITRETAVDAIARAPEDDKNLVETSNKKPSDEAQNNPNGHMVAAQQAQQQAAAVAAQQNTALNGGKKSFMGAVNEKPTVSSATGAPSQATPQVAGQTAVPDALTAKAVEPVAPRPEVLPQMSAARDLGMGTTPALTPERLAGMPDGGAAAMVATGLSGMKSDSGFMSSMSLLGGNPSRGLQGHVAKQLNMSVSRAVKAGEQEFTLRLDPAELGRVQVKMRFMDGGRVHAQVIAERPETLELLQKDSRGLERALNASGQKGENPVIEFSLDQGNHESAGRAFAEAVQQEKMRDELAARAGGGREFDVAAEDAADEIPLDEILPYVDAETGLDIRV